MHYFIYENRAQGRVRIHVAGCGFCAAKDGFQQLDPSRNGQWHGPYEREAAFSKAAMLGWSDVRPCPTCRP